MKNIKNKTNENKLKIITFWSIMGLITIAFIILLILTSSTRQIQSLSRVKHLKRGNLFTQEEEVYYVYVYDSSDVSKEGKNHNLKPIIFNYANFAMIEKLTKYKIYCFDVNYPSHKEVKSFEHASYGTNSFEQFTVDEHDLPILITIEGGSIQDRKTKELDIEKELGNRITEILTQKEESENPYGVSFNNWDAILDKKEFLV